METNLKNDAVSHYNPNDDDDYNDDSNCSTPYVSAPSSPGHRLPPPSGFFFYSAPTSPMHYVTSAAASAASTTASPACNSFEFEFTSRFDSPATADELFLNGQIRPMKLCAHLSRPQLHDTIEEGDESDEEGECDVVSERSRDGRRLRNRSQRRRTRSMSPLRSTTSLDWLLNSDDLAADTPPDTAAPTEDIPASASSSRCSSAGRSSKRWVFLKDFLRSKSEGSSNNKFWHNINVSFSPSKEKEKRTETAKEKEVTAKKKTAATAAAKRRSAHEMHYAANRAQAEEMRKKTYLPYRQGLLGCLGFNSKSYGALNGFARALNPVSSR
ncbi:uncharacterized protein LOC141657571 [Silene latifolia]|uniref:uncharacterized protein LOC141657571 n=1 Tax=Silene latifolia TaxID=37657 RepID=UPI003D781B75